MPKILLTGGAGYIGAHTAHLLLRRGYDVLAIDDLTRGHRHNVAPERLRVMELADTEGLYRLMSGDHFDAVIHFAAYISVGESTQAPELYFANNVGGSISLLTAMTKAGVNRIVFSSTAAVYGNPAKVPITEDSPFDPVSPYGESKVMVEKILGWMDRFRNVRSIALRYFNACGAEPDAGLGEEHDPETHLIPLLFRAILTDKPITIFGTDYDTADGTCVRDYIHVADLAEAHILAVEHLMRGGDSGAYNVGTGSGLTVMEVLRAVEEITGKKVPYSIGPRREGDAPVLVANSDKLQRALNWKPERSTLRRIVQDAWEFELKRQQRSSTSESRR
jgi:UDP-glucose-4-epimerase GalE